MICRSEEPRRQVREGKDQMQPFDFADAFSIEDQLSGEERMIRESARAYATDKLLPRASDAFLNETEDPAIFREMGALGLLGLTLPERYGGSNASYVSYGLAAREIERVDSGYRSMMSVQSSLVMYPIHAFGSEEQRQHYLPKLARGEAIGAFGLTEPDAGSDPGGMRTRAVNDGAGFRLSGGKTWISNAPIADIFVIWAKSDAHGGRIRGFVVDKDTPGLSVQRIKGKLSLRTSVTGMIMLDDVRVGPEALLPGAEGLKGPFSCLNRARYGISFGALGAPNSVITPPANMGWSASSSARLWPAGNFIRKSWRTWPPT